jgi:hypothetical protein
MGTVINPESTGVGGLLHRITDDVKTIAKDELELAKNELAHVAKTAAAESAVVVLGGIVALIACWDVYNAASKKDTMSVTIGIKWSYTPSEYEDEPGRYSNKIDPAIAMPPGPESAADQCVRAAVEPAIKALNTVRDTFTTKLTITVK